ncbi:MAG: alpha/beta hydrolase [Solirubrobacterales bacterium]
MAEREDVHFDSEGARCAGWLYRPDGDGGRPPIVVLAHGFGGTKEGRLAAYAERFAEAGIAALVFDYRHFGDSEGEPRQLLSIAKQHADWRAAIAYARGLKGIDPGRLALWGTSYSGGHAVALGSGRTDIAAVVAQAPFADGTATLAAAGPVNAAKLTIAGLRDAGRAALGREPKRIAIAGEPGEQATMNQPGALDGYLALFGPDDEFRNEVTARSALELGFYSPLRKAKALRCPLLVLTCGDDTVTPPEAAKKMSERAPEGRHIDYPGWAHFDIYVGEQFERTISDQVEFLVEHLRP